MGYDYNYDSDKDDAKKKAKELFPGGSGARKKVFIASVIVLAVMLVYAGGSSYTGYVTYTKGLQAQLNETRQTLDKAVSERDECGTNLGNTIKTLDSCNTELNDAKSNVVSCEEEKNILQAQKNEFDQQITACNADNDKLSADYQDALKQVDVEKGNYKELVRSSVKRVCCTLGDAEGGSVRNWNIANNGIICVSDGAYTINCTSGETSF